MWLLIEGGSYSRAGFINFSGYCTVPSVKTATRKTGLRGLYFKQPRNDQKVSGHATVEQRQARLLHVSALNKRLCTACDHSHIHLIVYVHACGYYCFRWCGYYSRATTIQGAASIRLNTVCTMYIINNQTL